MKNTLLTAFLHTLRIFGVCLILISLYFMLLPDAKAYKLGTTEVPEVDLRAYGYENEGYNSDDAEFDNMIDIQMERDRQEYDSDFEYDLDYQKDYE